MPCMVDLTGWNSFLAWRHTNSLQTRHCQGVSCVSTLAISKRNESWNPGLLLLWHLMHVWKLRVIYNGGPGHIKSNAMIKTKTYCDTRPFIGVHTVLFGESIVPRSYNRYRGGRNSVSSRRLVVFLEQVRQEADRNIISNYLAMHGHWLGS